MLIDRIVAVSTRHSLIVVLVAALLTAGAGMYAARHFTMTANTEDLISPRLEWRQRDLEFRAVFPQFDNLTMVVVDGKTPELADSRRAACRCAEVEAAAIQDCAATTAWSVLRSQWPAAAAG